MAPTTTIDALFERYDALLLDAYGVLVDQRSALPGAAALIARLERESKPYAVVTNDASKLETTSASVYGARGIEIDAARIVTSGSLLGAYFEAKGLEGRKTLVLGPEDSLAYVERAGGVPVAPDGALDDVSVLVVGDEAGFDFLPGMDRALSLVLDRLDTGRPIHLVLPNPDLIYPQDEGAFGFAAGSIALLIEEAIELRHPGCGVRFERLGKPHPAIFEAAVARVGTRSCVMIGDQLRTDVRGARAFGIDVALATWGLTKALPPDLDPAERPTWLLDHL